MKSELLFFVVIFSLVLLVYPINSVSQTLEDDVRLDASDGIEPPDDVPVGPVGNTGAEYKFDAKFYQKIQDIMLEEPHDGDPGVYDGKRYYNVIMVVSSDDGDDRELDETASENKDAIVKRLELLGARDIISAESLSFVTASISVTDIPGFSLHDEIYALGDGELPVISDVDTARHTIHATSDDIRLAIGRVLDGMGVLVAVVDTGINSIYLNDKVADRIYCGDGVCKTHQIGNIVGLNITDPYRSHYHSNYTSHGTQVAQVLAASGIPITDKNNNGIAPNVTLLDAMYGTDESDDPTFLSSLAHSLDWSHSKGADIANISAGSAYCDSQHTTAFTMIINEAVDKGMLVVKSAGNQSSLSSPKYNSITNPGCAHNVITVGGINDRADGIITMFTSSSRGPSTDTTPRLLPHIVAPAYEIQTLSYPINATMHPRSGTSYAAPQVSAAAAMMLQIKPELTPAEVKAALLLGANWKGPIPCTSKIYEQNVTNPTNCSYKMQPVISIKANDSISLGILNNVGFGVLNVAESLRYVTTNTSYVISDHLENTAKSKQYRFTVTDTSVPVKIILTWLVHPHGEIAEQESRTDAVPIANLDLSIVPPRGNSIDAKSAHQTTEFAVFNPPVTGTYTITVSTLNLDSLNKPVQTFALASTIPLVAVNPPTSENSKPIAQSRTMIVAPGVETAVRLSSTDSDGDAVTFRISQDPTKGIVTTDELITKSISRVVYTPDDNFAGTDRFQVTPHDGTASGTPATITLNAEQLPKNYTSDINSNTDDVRDWDTLDVTSKLSHNSYAKTFSGKNYQVSALVVGSVNMEGTDLSITTGNGTYTVAITPDYDRRITFPTPITIQNITLSADGIEEEIVDSSGIQRVPATKVHMFVGYVQSASDANTPQTNKYMSSTNPNIAIPDNTDSQDVTSMINVPVNGTLSSLSVSVDITHTFIGDLNISIIPPGGNAIVLHNQSGGGNDNIDATYESSTHVGLGTLKGTQINGNWTLSVGDYDGGDIGTLNSWTFNATYITATNTPSPPPTGTSIFSEDFEGTLGKWIETGDGDWAIVDSLSHGVSSVPDSQESNRTLHADNCDYPCILTLKDSVDLTSYSKATLSLWRFVDSGLDSGEYLKVELYDGTSWRTAYDWSEGRGNTNKWHSESYDLASYLTASEFKIRLVTKQSSTNEDIQLDDVVITGTSHSIGEPTPDATRPSSPQSVSVGMVTALSATVSWQDPANNGGSSITDYIIQYRKSTSSTWITFDDGVSTTKSSTIPDLSVNTGYKFRVAAVNSVGTGTYSAIVSANTESTCPSNYIVINSICNPGKVTVSGYVFRDADRDGIKDLGEGGVNNVSMKAFAGGLDNGVNVHGNELKSTRTNSNGYYTLSDIPTGSDSVTIQIIQDGTQIYTTSWHIIILGSVDSGTRTFNVGLR